MRVGLAAALLASMRTTPADSTYAREAVVVARDALAHARKLDLPLEAANAHAVLARGLAQLGFWDHAEREFEAAIHELEALGAQVDLARALLDFARAESVRAPASRPGSLSMRIERAMQLADTLGMRDVRAMASRLLSTVNA
jgi:hypothetical protein